MEIELQGATRRWRNVEAGQSVDAASVVGQFEIEPCNSALASLYGRLKGRFMSKQTEDDIQVVGNGKILPLVFFDFLGRGVMEKDGVVTLGVGTHTYGIDLEMTKAQAREMAERLLEVAK
jgi:hypothetical protein